MKEIFVVRYSNGESYDDYQDYPLVAYSTRERANQEVEYIENNLEKFYTTDERLSQDTREDYKEWFPSEAFTTDTFCIYVEKVNFVE